MFLKFEPLTPLCFSSIRLLLTEIDCRAQKAWRDFSDKNETPAGESPSHSANQSHNDEIAVAKAHHHARTSQTSYPFHSRPRHTNRLHTGQEDQAWIDMMVELKTAPIAEMVRQVQYDCVKMEHDMVANRLAYRARCRKLDAEQERTNRLIRQVQEMERERQTPKK